MRTKKKPSSKTEQSGFFLSLCGDWAFHFFKNELDLKDFLTSGEPLTDTIKVPRSWQMLTDRGYDTPHYAAVFVGWSFLAGLGV